MFWVLGIPQGAKRAQGQGRRRHSPTGESPDRSNPREKGLFGLLFEEGMVLHGREGRATGVASSKPAGTWGSHFTYGGQLGQEATNRI